MNIFNILKDIGIGLISESPIGKIAIPVINALLPDDKKLPINATGEDAAKIIKNLPPEQRAKIELAEIDLQKSEIEGMTDRYKAMCSADGQETRAKLVDKAMNTLILLSLMFVSAMAYVYVTEGAKQAFSVEMVGAFIAVTGVFAYVVRSYFGDLRVETKSRHATIDTKQQPASLLTNFLAKKINS